MKRSLLAVAAFSAIALAADLPLHAGTASTTFTVTATVAANCTIAATGIAFTYDPVVANATAAATSAGSVTIACTKGSGPIIGLNAGANAGRVAGVSRAMANGTNYLGYEIYQQTTAPGNGGVWTDTTGINPLNTGTSPSKAPRTFTASGSVPAGQDVAVGAYTDTITATVNF